MPPEDEDGLLKEANPPRDVGTAARVGTDKPPSPPAAARLLEGTTFPALFPLLETALPPPPPPPPGLLLLLLVLGTELAPPEPCCCCGRLLDMTQGPTRKSPKPAEFRSKHPDRAAVWLLQEG